MNLVLALSLIFAAAAAPAPAAAAVAPPTEKVETLTIETAKGDHTFKIEVVKDEADRNRGLMYRKHMDADRGMLFDYDPPQQVGFWMKNTYISLDIIFVDVGGEIITIAEKTKPLSLDTLPSGGKIRGVFEINGGLCQKLGIKVGDRVRHRFFEP